MQPKGSNSIGGPRTGAGAVALLVVVAMLAVFAWVGVPRVVQARLIANEADAIADLRRIAAAQQALEQPVALAELLASDSSLEAWEMESDGHVVRAGYRIAVHVEGGDDWSAFAWPIAAGTTGERAFAVDGSGRVFATSNRLATPEPESTSIQPAQAPDSAPSTGTDQ